MTSTTWTDFVNNAAACRASAGHGMANILTNLSTCDRWDLPWYDNYRNLDGGLMIVGMDFGNEDTVQQQRAFRSRDSCWEPGEGLDKSYVRLTRFLKSADLAREAFLTNAALCVRSGMSQETDALPQAIYNNCSRHLRAQVSLAKPYVIVALGKDALDFTCDALRYPRLKQGVTKIAGDRIPVRVNRATVTLVPFFHPSRPQNAHGWPDDRQLSDLYRPIRAHLDDLRSRTGREAYRQAVGILQ